MPIAEPIVFISHLRVRHGQLEDAKRLVEDVVEQIRADKPQTNGYLVYASTDESAMTIVHIFRDAAAMDLHFAGADSRSQAAYQVMEQLRWEIYGEPSEQAMATMHAAAARTGAVLTVLRPMVGGFLR